MWFGKEHLLPVLALMFGAAAGPMECPPALPRASGHPLANASLFDGPPAQMADLVPDRAGDTDRWDLDGIDPYLVCRFARTDKTVVLHAVGAGACRAGGKPFRAGCQ
jgi:hypothetical protein